MMKEYLVLTAARRKSIVSEEACAALADEVGAVSFTILGHNAAAFLLDNGARLYRWQIRKHFSTGEMDVNYVLAADFKPKKMLIADMESTIIKQECLDELAAYIGRHDEMVAITKRAMRGELDFEEALRARVAMLRNLPLNKLEELYKKRIKLMKGADVLLATMKAHGAFCGLVSGGFEFFAERIAARLRFDAYQCNTLLDDGEKLIGKVGEPILGRDAKGKIMQKWCEEKNIDASEVLAVGDGANDLAMLHMAGMGVAYHAKRGVRAGYHIADSNLEALLYLQGYTEDQFVRS